MEPPIKTRDIFYNYYADLTSVLGFDVENLLPQLIGQRILTNNDAEIIRKTASPSEKAGKLLSIIAGPLDAGNQGSFEKLLYIMADNGNGATREAALEIMKEIGITPKASSKKHTPHSVKTSTTTPATHMKPKLQDILNWVAPYVTDKWEKIFVQLLGDEHRHVMATIRKDHHHSSETSCQVMFEQWLELCPNPSWNDLISALRANSVRKIALAEELIKRLANLSTASPTSPTQPPFISPKQQHEGARGPAQLVVMKGKEPEEKFEEQQPVEATDGGTDEPVITPQAALTKDCGKGTVLDAVFTEVKRAVCRIHAPQTVGTGFIGYINYKDKYITVLVTANHVIPKFEDAKASRIAFENLLPDNKKLILKGFEIFTGNFWSSPLREQDYSIMEVDDNKIIEYDIQPIHLSQPANIKNGDQVYVIQHPRGGSLAFSSSDSTVKSPFLYYKCTTEKGSSGSPVLKEVDGELKIVALHRGTTDGNQCLAEHNCGTLIKEIQLA